MPDLPSFVLEWDIDLDPRKENVLNIDTLARCHVVAEYLSISQGP